MDRTDTHSCFRTGRRVLSTTSLGARAPKSSGKLSGSTCARTGTGPSVRLIRVLVSFVRLSCLHSEEHRNIFVPEICVHGSVGLSEGRLRVTVSTCVSESFSVVVAVQCVPCLGNNSVSSTIPDFSEFYVFPITKGRVENLFND